jgi:hypothetical protein
MENTLVASGRQYFQLPELEPQSGPMLPGVMNQTVRQLQHRQVSNLSVQKKMTAVPNRHSDISTVQLQAHQILLGHGSAHHDSETQSVSEAKHASVHGVPSYKEKIILTAQPLL